jgi:hypothetical protein
MNGSSKDEAPPAKPDVRLVLLQELAAHQSQDQGRDAKGMAWPHVVKNVNDKTSQERDVQYYRTMLTRLCQAVRSRQSNITPEITFLYNSLQHPEQLVQEDEDEKKLSDSEVEGGW